MTARAHSPLAALALVVALTGCANHYPATRCGRDAAASAAAGGGAACIRFESWQHCPGPSCYYHRQPPNTGPLAD